MRRSPLARYLPLAAFLVLLAAPGWLTTVALGATAAIAAIRVARHLGRVRAERGPTGHDSIPLGRDRRGRQVMISDHDLSAHGLILGASGAGKTTTLTMILEQQIRRGRPVVAIDMKGSPAIARELGEAAVAAGRPFKLWTPEGPSHWNPLQHGNATELKDKLICTERFTEPHYKRAAERYLQTVLQVIEHLHPEQPATLEEVVALMDPRRLPATLRGIPQPLADRVLDYVNGLTPDQRSAIRGLQTRLGIITDAPCSPYLAPAAGGLDATGVGRGGSIDLAAALSGEEVVLFSLNSSRYGEFAAQLGTLAVQDLISATGSRLELLSQRGWLEPATIAIDEFSGIGGAHIVALFARGREAGISCLVATQEMADLDRAGQGVRDQILGNTAFKLILRQDVPQSAELVAQMAGTEKVWVQTRQIGWSFFGGSPPGGTRREAEQFIVHPNEIKSLPVGEAVVISKLRGARAQPIRVTPPQRAPSRGARGPSRQR